MAGVWDMATTHRLLARQWRLSWHSHERPRWWLFAVVLLLHALLAIVTQRTLEVPVEQLPAPDDEPLQMRFVTVQTTPMPVPRRPLAPPPPPRTPTSQANSSRNAPAAQPASAATASAPVSAPALRLYAADGRILLPASAAKDGGTSVPNTLQGNARIMRGYDPLNYKATPFEPYFPPLNESAGGSVVRRAVDTVIKTREVDLPRGIHLQCKTVLGILTPKCTMPPPTASPKDGDARLNMAPAEAMTAASGGAPPPSVTDCINIYRAGKPLPWGCPVDTPTRAVDAELKEHHARGGTDLQAIEHAHG